MSTTSCQNSFNTPSPDDPGVGVLVDHGVVDDTLGPAGPTALYLYIAKVTLYLPKNATGSLPKSTAYKEFGCG